MIYGIKLLNMNILYLIERRCADNIVSIIINNIHKKVSKTLEEKWTIKNSKIEYCHVQSAVSSTFFDLFLGIRDEYFERIMPLE
ncbi:unknown [Rickettsia conorii str. Malish 7]|uniref:Uncharacterized protein RC0786 n=2 Tax=Rickettsia TaxID=780 RepID=Y786_RICCN|nr:RecName: Full=Uncharacterized protein RC0786 [Rickettsia conorii str. Malish 7]AAL03324.1 unknown [Rickettsia conorii str. Malish 7]